MFGSFSNSWRLIKASANILNTNKSLLIYPFVSAIASIIVIISFFVPLAVSGLIEKLDKSSGAPVIAIGVSFLFYVVLYTVIFFCNTALVGSALMMLRGGNPTVSDGFSIARERLSSIVGYAMIAATVGMVLRAISERSGIVGRIISGILGFAWTVATFLVVPILVIEKADPLEAIKRSAALLRQTWGEQLVGSFSMGSIFGLLMVGIIILGGMLVGGLATALNSVAVGVLGVLAIVLAIVLIGLYSSALQGIYTAALYEYAAQGKVSDTFDADLITNAFKRKNG
ncbi:MAG: hypothetical protein KF716_00005 [Anaerolineae bacterium]|nr:hypothetical protein [Anaerolineae bacterium]